VDVHQAGKQADVTSNCSNSKCTKPKNTWHSQPFMPGTKLPAGNFLLCLAILLAGGSASEVFTVFSHMGLGCLSLNTFHKYQRVNTDSLLIHKSLLHLHLSHKSIADRKSKQKLGLLIHVSNIIFCFRLWYTALRLSVCGVEALVCI